MRTVQLIARGVMPSSVYMQPTKPLHEGQLTYLLPPIQRIDIEFKRYSLTLLLSGTSLNAVLALNTQPAAASTSRRPRASFNASATSTAASSCGATAMRTPALPQQAEPTKERTREAGHAVA